MGETAQDKIFYWGKALKRNDPEVIKWAKIKMLCDFFNSKDGKPFRSVRGVAGKQVDLMEEIRLLGSGASLKSLDREINKGVK